MDILIKKEKTISFILVGLFLLTIPLEHLYSSIIISILAIYSIFLLFIRRHFDLKFIKKMYPLILFYLIITISVFYTENKNAGYNLVIRFLPFLAFPFIFSVLNISKDSFLSLIKFFIFWMTLLALYSHISILIQIYQNNDKLFDFFNIKYSYISLSNDTIGLHAAYYSYYLLITIISLIYLISQNNNRMQKAFLVVVLLYQSFFIFHLSSRTSIVALFLLCNFGILYYFIRRQEVFKGIIFLALFYLLTGITGYNVRVTRYRFQQIFGFTFYNGIHHDDGLDKLKQWSSSCSANNNFIFGNGVGDADDSICESYEKFGLYKFAKREYNAHNQFIQTFVGTGLIGLSILLLIFIYYFKLFYKNNFLLGYLFLIVSFVLFLTESFLQRYHGIVMFSFILSFYSNFLMLDKLLKGNENTTRNHKKLY